MRQEVHDQVAKFPDCPGIYIFVDERGTIRDGDDQLCLFGLSMHAAGALPHATIAATVIAPERFLTGVRSHVHSQRARLRERS